MQTAGTEAQRTDVQEAEITFETGKEKRIWP